MDELLFIFRILLPMMFEIFKQIPSHADMATSLFEPSLGQARLDPFELASGSGSSSLARIHLIMNSARSSRASSRAGVRLVGARELYNNVTHKLHLE
jgi:hypothetical protein